MLSSKVHGTIVLPALQVARNRAVHVMQLQGKLTMDRSVPSPLQNVRRAVGEATGPKRLVRLALVAGLVGVVWVIFSNLLGAWPAFVIMFLASVGAGLGFWRIKSASTVSKPHSRVRHYASYVALWTGLPAFLFLLLWIVLQGPVIDQLLLSSLPAAELEGLSPAQIGLLLSEIKNIAAGVIFGEPGAPILAAADRYLAWTQIASLAKVVALAAVGVLGLTVSRSRINLNFRARQGVERIIIGLMIGCSTLAIFTTIGIVGSLIFEASRFFQHVPLTEFLFGTRWEPQIAIRADQVASIGAFGAIPVFTGTILISAIAIFVATALGLPAAIYLSEFANTRMRGVVKPLLEVLAGVPTIVYGFFAVLVVAPAIRNVFGGMLGLDTAPGSALAAGLVMGIMIIPFVSSLADDAISAVPQALKDGATALGATRSETVLQVVLPAALPGIAGGMLLAISRAIGETMIVVMAAGIFASLTINPLDSVTTVTVQIVTLLIGDTAFDNPKTLSAFGLALFLFIFTLMLNVIALRIVQKYQERYD